MNIVEVLEKTMAVFVSNGNSIYRQLRQDDVWCKIKLGLIIDETREKNRKVTSNRVRRPPF